MAFCTFINNDKDPQNDVWEPLLAKERQELQADWWQHRNAEQTGGRKSLTR